MTKVALLALLATAKIPAAPVYYKADILLTSAYRVLEWSRTPGLMARSFIELNRVDPGFRPERLLSMLLSPAKYGPNLHARAAVVERMLARIRALPQVTSAASIHFLPLSGMGSGSGVYRADRADAAPRLDSGCRLFGHFRWLLSHDGNPAGQWPRV